jgi:hypothetical protein
MEDKKDYNRQQPLQKFYFTDDGKLVVESNRGVWVDGEQYVKMYGNFVCNAKTMGIIINKFKESPVIVKDIRLIGALNIPFMCESIVNPTEEDNVLIDELKNVTIQRDGLIDRKDAYKKAIEQFNSLPWYKRLFKKIEIK